MNKLGGCICDRCCRIIGAPFCIQPGDPMFFVSSVKKTKMHFCSDQCKLTFLKGKKYWNQKTKLQNDNFARLQKLSEKCL